MNKPLFFSISNKNLLSRFDVNFYHSPNVDEFFNLKGLKGNENLKFNFDNVDYSLLPKLYNRGHCFVSATMA